MPSISSIECLKAVNMTETIRRLDTPYSFYRALLFGDERPQDKEDIEIGTVMKVRSMAPFVREGSSALMFIGRSRSLATVAFPNIRIKKPFNPGDVYFDRFTGSSPGTIFNNEFGADRMQERLTDDLVDMEDMVLNTEEYLCSQAVQGVISYDVDGHDSFTVDYQKPADTLLAAADQWDSGTATIWFTFLQAKRDLARRQGGGYLLTDCVMGAEAADAFMKDADIFQRLNRESGINIGGPLDFTQNLEQNGSVQFLGTLMNVRCWSYTASLTMPDYSTVEMQRSKFAEFLSVSRQAENVMYYGGITDPRALQIGGPRMKRFSKSWMDEDPGSIYTLLQSRPLPVPRRPDSMQSYQVIA